MLGGLAKFGKSWLLRHRLAAHLLRTYKLLVRRNRTTPSPARTPLAITAVSR